MGRTGELREYANKIFHTINTGSYQKRKYRKNAIHRFINSLYISGQVPPKWHALTQSHIKLVIGCWRSEKLSDDSIRKYLGELRYFLQVINHSIKGIDNKSLGVIRSADINKEPFNENYLQKISDKISLLILLLQTEFGLTLSEAFKFCPDAHIKKENLLLSRDITNDSLDRVIPIDNNSQQNVIKLAEQIISSNINAIEEYGYEGIRIRYRHEIKKIGLTPSVNYRYVYANNRFVYLSKKIDKKIARKMVLNEMGVTGLTFRRYINEQNKTKKC